MAEPKRKRRWFRFSLRTLLVVLTLLCVWLGIKVNSARNQRQLVAKVHELGGQVKYDYEFLAPFGQISPPPEMDWLSRNLGVDYFHDVVSVGFGDDSEASNHSGQPLGELGTVLPLLQRVPTIRKLFFSGSNIRDGDVQCFSELRNLQYLLLFETNITGSGLKHLANARKLEMLWIFNSPITDQDLDPLLQLPMLKCLRLRKTKITDAGVKKLANIESLEALILEDDKISDASIEYLGKLPKLSDVDLTGTDVTPNGTQQLQALRPSLFIKCFP